MHEGDPTGGVLGGREGEQGQHIYHAEMLIWLQNFTSGTGSHG